MARRSSSRGFTLVELLVVITIIGMLVSLLLPAIQAAREAGRRNTCQSNMRQAALGLIQFAEVKKGFPGYVNAIPKNVVTAGFIRSSWVVSILPALERNDLYQNWQDPAISYLNASGQFTNGAQYYGPVSVLVCPSNANPDLGSNPLSFVVNTGIAVSGNDTCVQTSGMSPTPIPGNAKYVPEDSNAGVFFNHVKYDGNAGSQVGFSGGKKSTADFISTNDGMSYTLLMSENLQATNWATDPTGAGNDSFKTDMTVRGSAGMVWFLTGQVNNAVPVVGGNLPFFNEDAMGVNDGAQSVTPGSYLLYYGMPGMAGSNPEPSMTNVYNNGGIGFARPSSNHPGGVNAAFCDGHMQYINDEIEYHVFTQLMTPNQKAVNTTPGSGPLTAKNALWIYILDESAY